MEAFLAGFRAPPRAPAVSTARSPPPPSTIFLDRRLEKPSSSASVVCMAEPHLISKLDSTEKAWKEMSFWNYVQFFKALLNEALNFDFASLLETSNF